MSNPSTTTSERDEALLSWISATDPSLAYRVLREVKHAPESEWAPVRARIATEGWGRTLLAAQDADGHWGGNADPYVPAFPPHDQWTTAGQPFTATSHVLTELRHLGLPPDTLRPTVQKLSETVWPFFNTRFWAGETEECINGRLLADAVYFRAPPADIRALVTKLLGTEQAEGGWNCYREGGSVRSSFDSTIAVLEGLIEFEGAVAGGTLEPNAEVADADAALLEAVRAARARAEAYLLARSLYRRLSTGEPALPAYLELSDEPRWRYDILRGLEYFRRAAQVAGAGAHPDARLADAVERVRCLRGEDGKWRVQRRFPGLATLHVGEVGDVSASLTLRAMLVLRWWDDAQRK